MLRALTVAVAVFATSCISALAEDETIPWKTVSGWEIFVDRTVGNGCYMTSLFEGGTSLRVGFLPKAKSIIFAIGNTNWKSIEAGKDYPVTIRMDNEAPWNAPAQGFSLNGIPMIGTTTQDPNFAVELKRKHGVRVDYAGKQIAALSLKGSSAAIDEMIGCQGVMNRASQTKPEVPAAPSTDPFQVKEAPSNIDPFET